MNLQIQARREVLQIMVEADPNPLTWAGVLSWNSAMERAAVPSGIVPGLGSGSYSSVVMN